MPRSIKFKNDVYLDTKGITHRNNNLEPIIDSVLNKTTHIPDNTRISISAFDSLGANPNLDLYGKPGLYPFYDKLFATDSGNISITWGCLIVIPYAYAENGVGMADWVLQVVIGAYGWDSSNIVKILTRRINYFGGAVPKWNIVS